MELKTKLNKFAGKDPMEKQKKRTPAYVLSTNDKTVYLCKKLVKFNINEFKDIYIQFSFTNFLINKKTLE